jgi:hypothetical protein
MRYLIIIMQSRIFSHFLLDLAERIAALRASGLPDDRITAAHLQRQLDDLRANAGTITLNERLTHPSNAGAFLAVMPDLLDHWQQLQPENIIIQGFPTSPHPTKAKITKALRERSITPAIHFNYGDRGSVSITPDRLTYTGAIADDPKALLAGVLHMKKHWPHGCRFGEEDFALQNQHPDYLFRFLVAAKMVGLLVQDPRAPRKSRWSQYAQAVIDDSRSNDVEELEKQWAPLLASLTALQSPGPKKSRTRPRPAPKRPGSRFRIVRARTSSHAHT